MTFNHIFEWRLLAGSHAFPGPDGGTCISEAALIAAGLEYQKIASPRDCPSCFSRPIASFAIAVNDLLLGSDAFDEDEKQSLLKPFVVRLAGTSDSPLVERQRYEFLIVGIVRDCVSLSLRGWQDDLAARAQAVTTIDEVRAFARALGPVASAFTFDLDVDVDLEPALSRALRLAFELDLDTAASDRRHLERAILLAQLRLLDGVLGIGRQADPLDRALIQSRMESVKRRAMALAANG